MLNLILKTEALMKMPSVLPLICTSPGVSWFLYHTLMLMYIVCGYVSIQDVCSHTLTRMACAFESCLPGIGASFFTDVHSIRHLALLHTPRSQSTTLLCMLSSLIIYAMLTIHPCYSLVQVSSSFIYLLKLYCC